MAPSLRRRRARRASIAAPSSSTSAAAAATRSAPPTRADRSRPARSPRVSAPTGRTSTCARRAARTCSSRSATAASRARSCPRTSWSARTPRTWRCSWSATPARSRRARRRTSPRTTGSPARGPPPVLDLKEIRRDPDAARAALERRRAGDQLSEVLRLDEERRRLLPQVESLRAEQKKAGQAIAEANRGGGDASGAIAEMKGVADRVKALEAELSQVEQRLNAVLASVPNLPLPSAPEEEEVVREVGEAGREGKDHLELLGAMVDMEAGAKLAGSRFAYLRGPLVFLELALVRWAMELLSEKGHEPVIPPVLVREEALFGTGFLPDTEQQIYRVPEDHLYLAGTSEVALASIHAGEILDAGELPRRYAGFSS